MPPSVPPAMDHPPQPYTVNGAGAAVVQSQQLALPPSVQRPLSQLVPDQQFQMNNINSFTPSCSRCRAKKLKCDTNLPCNQCIAKDLDDECRKDSRIPRGRKRPKDDISQADSPQDEIASLKKRIRELETAMVQRSRLSSGHTSDNSIAVLASTRVDSSRGSTTTGSSEIGAGPLSRGRTSPTPLSTASEDEVDEAERALYTLEQLAASDPRVGEPGHGTGCSKQINDVSSARVPRDRPHTFYNKPSVFQERYDMLVYAKRLIPDKMVVDELVHAFSVRCHNLVGHVVHMPSFAHQVNFFNTASVEEIIVSPLDMYDLARYLMVLRLGMRFYPGKGNMFIDPTAPAFIAINALKNRGDDISRQWYDLAKKALAADRVFCLGSFTAIQTALLMILDGRDSPTYLRMLLRISIQTALDMGLHRLGDALPTDKNPEEDLVRLETAVRIWWYLVVKDWCSAQREGAYTIHPSQMTTRRPLHTNDQRLSEGRTDEVPHDKYTEMSYILCQIQLVNIIRESIDLRNEESTLGGSYDVISATHKKLLQVQLESFLSEDLPPFYRLESSEMNPGVLGVQRCLLHQQTFDVLLKLNRKSLASYSERTTCTLLAEQIVSTQKLLRSVCPVIDGFWVNFRHLFGATLTLTISLLLDECLDDEVRSRRREKVHQALATMRETPGSDRGSWIIETLLREEENGGVHERGSARRKQLDLAALTRSIVAQTAELPVPAARDAYLAFPGVVDEVPDESIVPVFASSWGSGFPFADPCDPTSLLSTADAPPTRAAPAPATPYHAHPHRPYAHSLRPWQDPPPPATLVQHNTFWDWALFQGALANPPTQPTSHH